MFSTTGLTESEITSQLRVAMFCPVRWRGGVHVDDSQYAIIIIISLLLLLKMATDQFVTEFTVHVGL